MSALQSVQSVASFQTLQSLFKQHLSQLQQCIQQIVLKHQLKGLWIYAGEAKQYFLDDQSAPFKINPHFNYFFPFPQAEKSWLFVDGENPPQIYFYAPQDYWHSVPQPPQQNYFASSFEWHIFTDESQLRHAIQPENCAFIGEETHQASQLGFTHINPHAVLNALHFARSIKTEYEIACIAKAQYIALAGHQAAQKAFIAQKSELAIHTDYLIASAQTETQLPYANIIALNQHSAILHYTEKATQIVAHNSLLVDAGATFAGYSADITRTYTNEKETEFNALIEAMDCLKNRLINTLQIGYPYLHYHHLMHQWIATLLHDFDFVRLPATQIFEQKISHYFFPHGLGHLLGLQVHDVGGYQQNSRGSRQLPPADYPTLRCTRTLAENMVLTIEPGFYFIDLLLAQLAKHSAAHAVNWAKIEAFKRFGGIRVEDNIVMRATGAENLTHQAELGLANGEALK